MHNSSSLDKPELSEADVFYGQWLRENETQKLIASLKDTQCNIVDLTLDSILDVNLDINLLRGRLHEARIIRDLVNKIKDNDWR